MDPSTQCPISRQSRWLHHLRGAWSVGWGVLCLLLIILWVRSFWRVDGVQIGKTSVAAMSGQLVINDFFVKKDFATSSYRSDTQSLLIPTFSGHTFANNRVVVWTVHGGEMVPVGLGKTVTGWPLMVVAATFAIVPWLRWHFSLRTLLIATAVCAIILGTVIVTIR